MGIKARLSRTGSSLGLVQHQTAVSSSSTLGDADGKRPGTLQEQKAIDVEAAISILQELRKTASPEELVALHKALLPTKDVETVTSPLSSKKSEQNLFPPNLMIRHRSMLPPGLATRGGAAEDVLRKLGEAPARSKQRGQGLEVPRRWGSHATTDSVSSLAALDLADDATNPVGPRAVTPLDFAYFQTGAFRPGTLHITNGAASPELSIFSTSKVSPDHGASEESHNDSFVAIQGRPSDALLPSHTNGETISVRDRILNSPKGQQRRENTTRRMSETFDRHSMDAPRPRASLQIDTRTTQQSVERGTTSPLSSDGPKSLQRLSQCASRLSQEYISDCEVPSSLHGDKKALLNFPARLSIVYDRGRDDLDSDDGTPQQALARLIGNADASTGSSPSEQVSGRTANGNTPPAKTTMNSRPHPVKHVDSGHGSDSTLLTSALQRGPSVESSQSSIHRRAAKEALTQVDEKDEVGSSVEEGNLYTFEEVLSSPSLLSDFQTPSPKTPASKKHPRLFALRSRASVKRSSLPIIGGAARQYSSDAVPTAPRIMSSPAQAEKDVKTEKVQHIVTQRKLQNPIPEHLRKQLKKKIRVQHAKDPNPSTLPEVPIEVAIQHSQRLDRTPSMAHLQRTYSSISTTDSEEDPSRATRERSAEAEFSSPNGSPESERSSSKHRSFSRGRNASGGKRSESLDNLQVREKTGKFFRRRSKSRSRSQSQKRLGVDDTGHGRQNSDDSIPLYTDFGSLARSIGSNPYDLSTNLFKRSAPVAAALQDLQSPYQISTGLIKSKSMVGMSEQAASQMARMKSRDVAGHDMVPMYDRPITAIPKPLKQASNRSDSQSTVSVEDRFPEWQGKLAVQDSTPQHQLRAFSIYAESIPPMPELPEDFDIKAAKAEEMVAKKLIKDSARSTPSSSARNSEDRGEKIKQEALKMAVRARKEQEEKMAEDKMENGQLEIVHPATQPAPKKTRAVNVEVRELPGSGSETSLVPSAGSAPAVSPTHDAQHPGWPGWEKQAQLWRDRRMSLVKTLPKLSTMARPNAATREASNSPAIIVSRYVTPLGAENAARANAGPDPTSDAARHADEYRGLLVDDKESRPAKEDVPRFGSAASTRTFVTVETFSDERPAKPDVPRTDSAFSTKTYQTLTSTITNTRCPGGRVRTPSGSFVPFSPVHALQAERSRALSLAKLQGDSAASSSESLPSIFDECHPGQSKSSPGSLFDRYGGGLHYGFQKGVGFSGSAGTRTSGDAAKRKSVQLSESYGLDLSDVPVFLKKM